VIRGSHKVNHDAVQRLSDISTNKFAYHRKIKPGQLLELSPACGASRGKGISALFTQRLAHGVRIITHQHNLTLQNLKVSKETRLHQRVQLNNLEQITRHNTETEPQESTPRIAINIPKDDQPRQDSARSTTVACLVYTQVH
jgi:hypothetical protein